MEKESCNQFQAWLVNISHYSSICCLNGELPSYVLKIVKSGQSLVLRIIAWRRAT